MLYNEGMITKHNDDTMMLTIYADGGAFVGTSFVVVNVVGGTMKKVQTSFERKRSIWLAKRRAHIVRSEIEHLHYVGNLVNRDMDRKRVAAMMASVGIVKGGN